MYRLWLENGAGNRIELTNSKEYSVLEIQGLNPPNAVINTSEIALYDGAKFNSSKVEMRTLQLSVSINVDAERNRLALYKVIKTKHPVNIYYENDSRNVFIAGYVESMDIDYFAMKQTAAISILCPEPYFKAAQNVIQEVSLILGAFHFPFAIEADKPIPISYYGDIFEINVINVGDVDCGLRVEIHASGPVKNPRIFNRDTREYMGVDGGFDNGDVIYINTQRGNKEITLFHEGKYTNIFNSFAKGSTWLQLETGDNVLTYDAEGSSTDYMRVRFIYSPLYEGV